MSNSFIMTESIVRPAKMPYGRLKDNGFVGIEGEHAARALVVETKDDLSAFASINLIIDDLDCGAMTKTTSGGTTTLSMTLTSSMIGRSGRKICQLIMVNSGNTVVQKSSQFEAYVGRANEIERSVDDGVTIIILSEAVTEMAREAAAAAAEEAVADVVEDCQAIADAASASADAAAQSASDAQTAAASITVDATLDPTSAHAIQNKAVASEIAGLKADLGSVSDLETESKTDLVSAINEAAQSGLSDEAKAALLACFDHVVWHGEGDDYYNNLRRTLYREDPFYDTWEWSSQATGDGALTKMPAGCSESIVNARKGISYNNQSTNIQNNKRRSFLVAKGKATVKGEGGEVAYYPIPIPKTATKATVTITPSSQQIGVYIFKLGDVASSDGYHYDTYPQTPGISWVTGESVVEFAASEDLFLALQCRVSASGAYSASTEPNLTIVFE